MLRLLLLPLFLFTLSMACMGQTFQYSRGWTNGKRALSPGSPLLANAHFHRSNELGLTDLYDLQDWSSDRRLERCLSQLQRSLIARNCAPGADFNANRPDADTENSNTHSSRLNNINNENVLYSNTNIPNRHRQSNELLEELNAAGGVSAEPIFGKH
ncbi:pro-corazonin [Drosophila ficusphila]|uniref:pro-corazonin n=1 Tax=Drosophila ficusphila TaxID=30025 RepID=UPI0007E701F5|nr:pro-corazonin [Drosophila ficusphila]